jgi:hypothetical protein
VYELILERFAVQGFRPLTLSASAQWWEGSKLTGEPEAEINPQGSGENK